MRTWTRRKRGTVIGRLYTVNPVENERYYLRLLLNNVRSPTSVDFLLLIDGVSCCSFQKAAHMRGLLQNDDDIDKTLEEASVHRMSSELRRLFATLLHYCKPSNPEKLFTSYYEYMAEDFKRTQSKLNLSDDEILHKYVTSKFEQFTREITAERNIPVPEEDLLAIRQLNREQKVAFDIIFNNATSGNGGAYFVDGPGGTGKSFLYKVILAHIRSKGFIGLIVASSRIAASNFLGGRTDHSRFKIPIDC
ncbi:hypothetical protein LIER_18121 [Lithospermum erythrorhizon]|uniref:ATP-dependent DNA helicase n=1 Tax=Lithospermum erythrorhizon TaxID=34254 RepID=A0AAV3QCT7_LITER